MWQIYGIGVMGIQRQDDLGGMDSFGKDLWRRWDGAGHLSVKKFWVNEKMGPLAKTRGENVEEWQGDKR